tara:strand:+ start:1578 stop:1877 length:300 start_codon:yes stop_codon:yes gene_type:complete
MATFNINIGGATVPNAEPNTYTMPPNASIILDVLENDFLGQTPTTIIIEIDPSQGTAIVNTDTIEYTPTTGYTGVDSFYYKITDSNSAFSVAKVNITIG